MGIIGDGMVESLREAQEQLNVRLDAILVELRTIHLLMEELGRSFADAPTRPRLPTG